MSLFQYGFTKKVQTKRKRSPKSKSQDVVSESHSPPKQKRKITNLGGMVQGKKMFQKRSDKMDISLDDELWTQKYRPQKKEDLIGNRNQIERLEKWLKNWKGEKQKGAILTGTAGIGKTSTARIVAESLGFRVVEMNASDVRSRNALKNQIRHLMDAKSLHSFFEKGKKNKICIVMDEVDGMSSGDRGGVVELVKMIKETKVPIICIANDRMKRELKTLISTCCDIQFVKPTPNDLFYKLQEICRKESMKVDDSALTYMIQQLSCDVRALITNLQYLKTNDSIQMYQKGFDINHATQRSVEKSVWNQSAETVALSMMEFPGGPNPLMVLFGKKTSNLQGVVKTQRGICKPDMNFFLKQYFYDDFFVPLLIEQNYINFKPYMMQNSKNPRIEIMGRLSMTAEALSLADEFQGKIQKERHYVLQPYHGIISCQEPSFHMRGKYKKMRTYDNYRLNFPMSLGKGSTLKKNTRLLNEIYGQTIGTMTTMTNLDILDYIPQLAGKANQILHEKGEDGIEEAAEFIASYHLNKDGFDAIQGFNEAFTKTKRYNYKDIRAPVKRKFTKKINDKTQQIQGKAKGMKQLKSTSVIHSQEWI